MSIADKGSIINKADKMPAIYRKNYRLRMAGRLPNGWYWADLELCLRKYITCYRCSRLVILSDRGCDCNPPVGIPEWLGKKQADYPQWSESPRHETERIQDD